jgi:hypothetical protein
VSDEASTILERAIGLWRTAQVVYAGPTRLGCAEPREAVFQVARDHPECHDGLVQLLFSDNQLVAPYALLTLQAMGSRMLEILPQELLERREKITIDIGSFRNSMDLGGLFRQVQKRAKQR